MASSFELESMPTSLDKAGDFTFESAVDSLGFGKFQMKLAALTGLAWMADAMEIMLLSVLSPVLHCDWMLDRWQLALITFAVCSGMAIGAPTWGYLTDKYGRKPSLILSSTISFYFGLLSAFSPNLTWMLILRGLTGFGIGGSLQALTLFAEYLPGAYRARCIILIELFWSFGTCLVTVIAMVVIPIGGWRWFVGICSFPMLIFVICCKFLPESARYHIVCGNTRKAAEILKQIAIDNHQSLPSGQLSASNSKLERRGRAMDLFGSNFRITTLILLTLWFTSGFDHLGIVLFTTELFNSPNTCYFNHSAENASRNDPCFYLSKEDYLDIMWTSCAEFPGIIVTALIIDHLGRRLTIGLGYLIFSVFVFSLNVCASRLLTVVFLFIARAAMTGVIQGIFVYTPEVYPTVTRAIGMGVCSVFFRLGATMTPFIAQILLHSSLNVTVQIYAISSLLSAVASVILPIETKGREMQNFVH